MRESSWDASRRRRALDTKGNGATRPVREICGPSRQLADEAKLTPLLLERFFMERKKQKKKSFAQKVRNREKTVLYEFLPPPKNLLEKDLASSLKIFSALVREHKIDAINIPEVWEEERSGKRNAPSMVKLEPRVVFSYFRKYDDCDVVINRPVVYHNWKKQRKWMLETYHDYGIRNMVFVGGESSKVSYPGLSVVETAATILSKHRADFPDIFLGGITIPTRKNEADRVLKKSLAGIEYFTTQVLYEAEKSKQFLANYSKLCKKNKVKPKTIFLSFAPVVAPSDIDLLVWLGVEVSKKTAEKLMTGWIGMGFRSVAVCEQVLLDILQFVKKQRIDVPIGLNVEHISRHNFEISFLLLNRLSDIYKNYDD